MLRLYHVGSGNRVTEDLWEMALSFLPEDLDGLARETGSITRPRRVLSASQMLRAYLLYAQTGSFRTASALVRSSGLLDITGEGLFYRLRHSEKFLESLLTYLTRGMCAPKGYQLLLVDATSVSGPGATGTDWRVHVAYDPQRGVPSSVFVSDQYVGERFSHHGLQPGQLVVGDRAYGKARIVHEALQTGANLLVRVQFGSIRLCDEQSETVKWAALESQVPACGAVHFQLQMPVPPASNGKPLRWKNKDAIACHNVRLIAARNTKGEIVWLLTDLDESRLSCQDACELYRVRWQVELYFKRLKSLGDLDLLGSRDGPTAKASLLAKLILLTLTSLLAESEQAFSPYGYPVRKTGPKPVA